MSRQSLLLWLILLPLLLCAADRPTVEQLFGVRTVTVQKTQAALTRTTYGFVRADEALTYDVSPRFEGYVETLYADTRYKKVNKGDALARVYAPEVLQAKEDYLSALRFSKQRPSDAKAMLRSVEEKLELLGVDPAEIDAVRKTMRADALTTLRAPVSGWLFEKSVRKGSAFKAGMTLFTIVDLKQVWVEASYDQEAMPILDNMKLFRVSVTGQNSVYEAKRQLLYPVVQPDSATLTLRLSVDNPDTLLFPGMYATITAESRTTEALTLPRTAVIRRDNGWYAFRIGDFKGVYDPVRIEVEALDAARYRVLSGLAEGDEVADDALFMLDADAQMSGLY